MSEIEQLVEKAGAVARPRVHSTVTRTLATRILSGEYMQGAPLPNQDDLSKALGVSRNTVREAIKVLSSKGLVEAKSRDGTRVRAQAHWNLLDSDVIEWWELVGGGVHEAAKLREFAEARLVIEPAAAELAARHATPEDLQYLRRAFERMRDALPHDVDGCCAADLDFHQGLLNATHNFVFAQLIGIMGAALRSVFRTTTHLARSHEAALAAHNEVLECVEHGDTAGARSAMMGILQISLRELREGQKL